MESEMKFGLKTIYITPKVFKHFSEIRNDDMYRIYYAFGQGYSLMQDEAYPELTINQVNQYAKANKMRVKHLPFKHYIHINEGN